MHAILTLPPGPACVRQTACRDALTRHACVQQCHAPAGPAWLPSQQGGDSWAPDTSWHVPQRSVRACAKRGRPKSKAADESPEAPQSAGRPGSSDAGPAPWDLALSGVPIDDGEDEDAEDLLDGEDEADLLGFQKDEDDEDENEDEDGLGLDAALGLDDEEDEDEDEDDMDVSFPDDPPPSQGRRQLPYKVERLTYDQAVARTKIQSVSKPKIRRLTKQEVQKLEADEAAASAKPVIIPAGAQMTLNRQGYQTFQMDELELLIGEAADGKLNLSDAFIYDPVLNLYAPPEMQGKIPRQPLQLQIIPWIMSKSPDSLKNKEAMRKMVKVYFIGVQSVQPYKLALEQVFCFEGATRTLRKESVWVAPGVKDPVLRIRPDGISVEDTAALPTPHQVSMQTDLDSQMSEEEKEARRQERIEELESQAEEVDELDEAPDVSASDMM